MTKNEHVQSILSDRDRNGGPFWSREDGDIHAPNGSSTIDTLHVLGLMEAKVSRYPEIAAAVNFIMNYQCDDGSFRYGIKSSKLPCMTARILAALAKVRVKIDTQLEKSYQLLLHLQSSDGGWRCNTVKLGKSRSTDASNPGTTLYVLDAFRFRKTSPKEKKALNRAVDFLLKHWETRKPLGPCEFGIGNRFFQTEFPFFRYNIFYYTHVLSFYGHAIGDQRYQAAVKKLAAKISDGNIILENPHRAWRSYDFAKNDKPSKLANRYWREIVKNTGQN